MDENKIFNRNKNIIHISLIISLKKNIFLYLNYFFDSAPRRYIYELKKMYIQQQWFKNFKNSQKSLLSVTKMCPIIRNIFILRWQKVRCNPPPPQLNSKLCLWNDQQFFLFLQLFLFILLFILKPDTYKKWVFKINFTNFPSILPTFIWTNNYSSLKEA